MPVLGGKKKKSSYEDLDCSLQAALKGKGLRDDITVIVVDVMPDAHQKLPPQLSKDGSGQLVASTVPSCPVNIFHPLEDTDAAQAACQLIVW